MISSEGPWPLLESSEIGHWTFSDKTDNHRMCSALPASIRSTSLLEERKQKTAGFADEANIMTKPSHENVNKILEICENFQQAYH